jgi:hypothetical protein
MDFLDLEKSDVAKLAGISKQSVRFDDAMPKAMFDRIEEVANVCNLVARVFEGNVNKTALWFRTRNPMLGDISPRDMLRFGRYDKLRRFVVGALADRAADSAATVTKSRSGRARPRAASE